MKMARPEHNTYDFPDDIITIYDVDGDIEHLKLVHGFSTKEEYIADIRKRHLGTDMIYAALSIFYMRKNKKLSDFYKNKVSISHFCRA